ncbi:MAG: ABC transporter substrate-binding protein [Oscillospiraceae bacterium]|nr:ABC transporter substrate-binding protein [Oscillospiraceae bacterium]
MKKFGICAVAFMILLVGCAPAEPQAPATSTTERSAATDASSNADAGSTSTAAPEAAEVPDARFVKDLNDRIVEIPANIESIICIGAGALRFTTYMKALDLVVGVLANEVGAPVAKPFAYVNSELFSSLPIIGSGSTPYEEEIVRLMPDVIIANMSAENADALQETVNIPVVTITFVDNIFDETSFRVFELLGEVYERQGRADELIAWLSGLNEDLSDRVSNIEEGDKPTVYVGGVNFMGSHGLDGTEAGFFPFSAVGARNLADEVGQSGHFNIDLEQVLMWDPDIIFIDFNGMALINESYANMPDFFNALTAVREGRLYSQISFRFTGVNWEMALINAYWVGAVVFPEQFADVDPIAKADEIFEMMLGTSFYQTLAESGLEFREMRLGE